VARRAADRHAVERAREAASAVVGDDDLARGERHVVGARGGGEDDRERGEANEGEGAYGVHAPSRLTPAPASYAAQLLAYVTSPEQSHTGPGSHGIFARGAQVPP